MKLTIGGATLENVAVDEAIALLKGLSNPEIKTKRKYKRGAGGWNAVWTEEEKQRMEEKVRKNFTANEIVKQKFFPNRSENGVRFFFYKTRKAMLRKRVNPVVFAPKEYLPS